MNKRNIVKTILGLLSLVLISTFLLKTNEFLIVYLISILFLITIYMFKYKDKIKKYKFIYDVILMLLMFFSSVLLIYMIVSIFRNIDYIITESQVLLIVFNIYFILKISIDNLINIKTENNKINDYLIIITFSIINLVFIRYYLDINNIIASGEKEFFIHQNHIYFFIMLFITEIHKYITNKLK